MDELGGDLDRSVEAQRIGADQVGLALLEFFLAQALERDVADPSDATSKDSRARSFLVVVPP